jgi:hypothetical protein
VNVELYRIDIEGKGGLYACKTIFELDAASSAVTDYFHPH